MAAKLHKLDAVGNRSAAKCLVKVLEDIEAGKVNPKRVVIVMEDENAGALNIRVAGPGMDFVPTGVGLLFQAASALAALTREAAVE